MIKKSLNQANGQNFSDQRRDKTIATQKLKILEKLKVKKPELKVGLKKNLEKNLKRKVWKKTWKKTWKKVWKKTWKKTWTQKLGKKKK